MINNRPFMVNGVRIIQSDQMLMDGPDYGVVRTWRERLTERPWRPFQRIKMVTPRVPANYSYRLPSGDIVMHPEMARKVMDYARTQP